MESCSPKLQGCDGACTAVASTVCELSPGNNTRRVPHQRTRHLMLFFGLYQGHALLGGLVDSGVMDVLAAAKTPTGASPQRKNGSDSHMPWAHAHATHHTLGACRFVAPASIGWPMEQWKHGGLELSVIGCTAAQKTFPLLRKHVETLTCTWHQVQHLCVHSFTRALQACASADGRRVLCV